MTSTSGACARHFGFVRTSQEPPSCSLKWPKSLIPQSSHLRSSSTSDVFGKALYGQARKWECRDSRRSQKRSQSTVLAKESSYGVRRLILLRHAKSSWKDPHLQDKERPLNKRGRDAAGNIGQKLKAMGWLPDLILCSDAVRTQETLKLLIVEVDELVSVKVHYLPSFYEKAAHEEATHGVAAHISSSIIELAKKKHKCVMCIGHNYGWEEAASEFCGQPVVLKTANAALLESFGHHWEDAFRIARSWRLVDVVMPDGKDAMNLSTTTTQPVFAQDHMPLMQGKARPEALQKAKKKVEGEPQGLKVMDSEKKALKVSDTGKVKKVFSGALWEATVGYCRALRTGNFIAIAGTIATGADGEVHAPGNAYAQTKRCLEIVEMALKELGGGIQNVTRTRMFVTDISKWKDYGRAHGEVFASCPPAASMVEVSALMKLEAMIEIEVDAILE